MKKIEQIKASAFKPWPVQEQWATVYDTLFEHFEPIVPGLSEKIKTVLPEIVAQSGVTGYGFEEILVKQALIPAIITPENYWGKSVNPWSKLVSIILEAEGDQVLTVLDPVKVIKSYDSWTVYNNHQTFSDFMNLASPHFEIIPELKKVFKWPTL